jgi:hypothetical protein
MQSAETVLGVLRERGRRGLPCDELYRQLFNPQLYLLAYGRIYANQGAMTPGVDAETVDGMSLAKIGRIIAALRHERYRFSPVKRVWIPKKSGRLRPLGLPTWSDKLVGEVVRLLLEAYYEPSFSTRSHGFRPGRGCHTALREVATTWTATTWFIEGDIADCFGSLDHEVMIATLAEKIHDNRFLRLIQNMLNAGYLEDWTWNATLSGVPQGGVVTPPTHWAMFGMFTLRVGVAGVVGVVGDAFAQRDAVPDGDLLGSDEDVLDEQLEHSAAFVDGGGLGPGVQLGEEAVQVGGEGEVGLAVGELGIQCVDLVAQVGLPGAQVGHAGAQLVDGDQLLAERFDHAGDAVGGGGQRILQLCALPRDGISGAGALETLVDLGVDQRGVGQQRGDVVPDHGVEVVGADGLLAQTRPAS